MTIEVFDCSAWQAGAYSGGGSFAAGIAKATEGRSFIDPSFGRHLAAIKAAGIIPGAYHFARPDINPGSAGAVAEADFHLAVVGDPTGMLLALDAESAGGDQAWCQAFTDRIHERLSGHEPAFYSYHAWMVERGISVARTWLWLAWPDSNGALPSMSPWGSPAMQQYGVGPVPGLAGNVDRNRFFGTLDELAAYAVGHANQGGSPMASGQCVYLNGVNHVFLLGSDGVVKWAAVAGGAGGILNPQQAFVNVPCFSTDIRDIWASQDRGPARPDGSGDVIDRLLLFATFGDGTWSFCVLNPADASYKILDWSEPLPGNHLRARVPTYQGQSGLSGPPGSGVTEAQVRTWAADEIDKRVRNG